MINKFINITNEFHILRHFKNVDENYKKTLIGKKYYFYNYETKIFEEGIISIIDIENALNTIGTKFDEHILGIENPKKLLELIYKKYNNQNSFIIDYSKNVGKVNCLLKDKIQDKSAIKNQLRSNCIGENNIYVNTISNLNLELTNKIEVLIQEIKNLKKYIITAFPCCNIPDSAGFDDLVFAI